MSKMMSVAMALAAVAASGCVREAKIKMPSDLAAQNETVELTGMGGARRGTFHLAGEQGRFTRGADRLAIFDPLLVRNRGGGSFSIAVAGKPIEGACGYRADEVNVGPISAPTRPFSYHCLFARSGRPIDAQLFIRAVPQAIGKEQRRGFVEFEGHRLEIRSIHKDAGGVLPNPNPLGYVFEREGQAVGAIDLNGPNKTLHVASGPARDAVIAASLALAVLWDPVEVW